MYNFYDKGCMIGVGITAVRVITLEEMRSGEIIGQAKMKIENECHY